MALEAVEVSAVAEERQSLCTTSFACSTDRRVGRGTQHHRLHRRLRLVGHPYTVARRHRTIRHWSARLATIRETQRLPHWPQPPRRHSPPCPGTIYRGEVSTVDYKIRSTLFLFFFYYIMRDYIIFIFLRFHFVLLKFVIKSKANINL